VLKAGDPLPYSDGAANVQSGGPESSSSEMSSDYSTTDPGLSIQDVTSSAEPAPTPTPTDSFPIFDVPTFINTTSSSSILVPTPTAAPFTTSSSQAPDPTTSSQAPDPTTSPQAPDPTPDPQPQTSTEQQAPSPIPTTSSQPEQSNQTPADTSGSNQGTTSSSDQQQYLQQHNIVRAQHGANPVTWSDQLEGFAQEWANNCQFMHSGGRFGAVGENIAAGTGDYTIPDMVGDWVSEVSSYNPSNPVASHFTQVVWKGTSQIGCAKATCSGIFPNAGPATFYVCEYLAAGNVIGAFAENVQV